MRRSILVVSVLAVALVAPSSSQAGKHRLMPSDAERAMYRSAATMMKRVKADSYKFDFCSSNWSDRPYIPYLDTPETWQEPLPATRPPFYCYASVSGVTDYAGLEEVFPAVPAEPIEGPIEFTQDLNFTLTGRSCRRIKFTSDTDIRVYYFNGCPRKKNAPDQ